ncbi:hypothetical protein F383_29438 [Gossypium arboreum]|uniref:Uncharacterized protein n=1 Tax=Gossypium arboreum TaxID=29729 RepID=A0A0B0MZ51_GOSAR|nr:hypothetical protein F383_29438 [Gossypium arboreum]
MLHTHVGPPARVSHTKWPWLSESHGQAQYFCIPGWVTHVGPTHPCSHMAQFSSTHESHMTSLVDHTLVFDHTAYHTGNHTPVWHRQSPISAFCRILLLGLWLHT